MVSGGGVIQLHHFFKIATPNESMTLHTHGNHPDLYLITIRSHRKVELHVTGKMSNKIGH